MSRILKKMPQFTNVAAGGTALANLPTGMTYNRLLLRATNNGSDMTAANIASYIDEIRVILDADQKITLSGAELVMFNQYYGSTVKAGAIDVIFSRPWMRSVIGEDALSYGTLDVQTMTVEVDINASATTPTLELYAEMSAGVPLGQHVSLRRFSYSYGGAGGDFEISDLPRSKNYGLFAAHLSTASISRAIVEANMRSVFEADAAIMDAYYGLKGRVVQTGYTHIDFTVTDRLLDVMPLDLQDFRFKLTMTEAADFKVVAERVEGQPAKA